MAKDPKPPVFDVFHLSFVLSMGFGAAVIGYVWVRLGEALLFPRANPKAIVAVTQSGYVTRCAAALIIGMMGGFLGSAVASKPKLAANVLVATLLIAMSAILLQTGFVP